MAVPKPYVGPAPTLDAVPAPTDWGQLVRHVGPVNVEGVVGGEPVAVTGTVAVTEPVSIEGTPAGEPVIITGTVAVTQPVTVTNLAVATRLDTVSAVLMYVGTAPIGSAEGSAVWQIKEVATVGAVLSVKWANAGTSDQVWTDRAGLVYT